MNKYWKHFKTIIQHKKVVRQMCFKFGIYKRGLLHDLSKFSIAEFAPSARYFQGTSSPIDKERNENGYSLAWFHHRAHNKHHQWYWIDFDNNQNPVPCQIPREYVYEMIADWIGAGMVYGKNSGREWSWSEPYNYYKEHTRNSKNGFPIWHWITKAMIDTILVDLKLYGIDYVADRIKRDYYGYIFYDRNIKTLEGMIYPWETQYKELVKEYYEVEAN